MTTIRVTRRPGGSATDVDTIPVTPPEAAGDGSVRPAVHPPVPVRRSAADPTDVGQTGVRDSEGGHPSR